MDVSNLISFLLAAMALTIMPGPDIIYVLTESLAKGARTGIWIAVGLISGILIHTAAAATGISLVLTQSDALFNALKIGGALYLLYLAYGAYIEKSDTINTSSSTLTENRSVTKLLSTGFFMNVLNPKVSLFFLALLPQFVSSDGTWPVWMQMIGLGVIFMIQGIIIFCLVALTAGRLSTLLGNERFWKAMKLAKIGVLVALGMAMFFVKNF